MLIIERHLPPAFTFTNLPHLRTYRSAYGGFVLSLLTVNTLALGQTIPAIRAYLALAPVG